MSSCAVSSVPVQNKAAMDYMVQDEMNLHTRQDHFLNEVITSHVIESDSNNGGSSGGGSSTHMSSSGSSHGGSSGSF